MSDDAVYVIAGFEKGSKKQRDHIQGYVYFTNAKSLARVKKYLPRAHLEIAKGTPKQNIEYCSKEGSVWTNGVPPLQGSICRDKLMDIMNNPYDNFHLYNQYRRSFEELKNRIIEDRDRYIVRISSHDMYDLFKVNYEPEEVCLMFDNYDGERVVVITLDSLSDPLIKAWSAGFPQYLKRGYQLIRFNPEIVYVSYKDQYEFERIGELIPDIYDDLIAIPKEDINDVEN